MRTTLDDLQLGLTTFGEICAARDREWRESLRAFNFPQGVKTDGKYQVTVKAAEGDSPAEILVHGPIGRSFWSADGITGKDFTDELNKIPVGTKVTVGVNSQGGAVGEGLAIYNAIQRRSADVTVRIDGYALSIASFFPLAAGKVISPESALWMIHNVWSWMDGTSGNAEDMRKLADLAQKAADMLEKHDDVLVAEYVRRTKKSEKEIRQAMEDETWLTGAEAVEWGLADETSDNDAALDALDFSGMEAKAFKKIPSNCRALILAAAKGPETKLPVAAPAKSPVPTGPGNNTTENKMNKKAIVALLKKHGIEASETETEEQLQAKLDKIPTPAASNVIPLTKADIDAAVEKAAKASERKSDAKEALAKLVSEKRISQAQADKALPAILAETGELKDSPLLATLRENPVAQDPAEPIKTSPELSADASPHDTLLAIARFDDSMKAWQKGQGNVSMKQLRNDSLARAHFIEKHAAKILPVLNTNTIPAGLQRSVILQTVIRDFPRRTIPLMLFSTKFENVPLEGTNKVEVLFYDLDTAASKSFKHSDGYVTGDTTTAVREIQVGKRADADAADDTKTYDRKYIGISLSSEEMARQPYLKTLELVSQKADKLLSDIVAHILGAVTAANFGDPAKTESADAFDSDDIADIKLACKLWPRDGRGLLLDSAYDVALLKDPAFKAAYAAASDLAIKEGRLFPRVMGFDYSEWPTIPENGEKLVGLAVFKSALLVAFAPVPPIEEVRNAGTTYQIVTEPTTGAVLEYRTFGDGQMDTGSHIIESSYGFAKGNGNACKRVTRP